MECKASEFQLDPSVTFLNAAYMSPLMRRVEEAGMAGLRLKRNPHQIGNEQFFEDVRRVKQQFAALIDAPDPGRVALVPSVSYGLGSVAQNLNMKAGDEIVVAGEQFPSNVYPWMRVANESGGQLRMVKPPPAHRERGKQWNERILEAINPKTRLVAIGHVHWADGTRFALSDIRARTRDVDALLVIDGSQSIGALPFSVRELQPDAVVTAAYKWLLGPYGIGLGWYSAAFDDGKPMEENWMNRQGSEQFQNLVNYTGTYQHGAQRYEVGERSNFILLPMLREALTVLNEWGVDSIQSYCRDLLPDFIHRIKEHGWIIEDEAWRPAHLFGIRPPDGEIPQSLKERINKAQISVSYRGDAIRVSPSVYNREDELITLAAVLLNGQ
ncbi:MAG: aminotransferase class V-fold PLP-dependent enzyme [Balneolaceae bacterium]